MKNRIECAWSCIIFDVCKINHLMAFLLKTSICPPPLPAPPLPLLSAPLCWLRGWRPTTDLTQLARRKARHSVKNQYNPGNYFVKLLDRHEENIGIKMEGFEALSFDFLSVTTLMERYSGNRFVLASILHFANGTWNARAADSPGLLTNLKLILYPKDLQGL